MSPHDRSGPGTIVAPEASTAPLPWHAQPPDQAVAALDSPDDGLTPDEAAERRRRYGPNRLTPPPRRSALMRFLAQFDNLLIYVLIGAGVVTVLLGRVRGRRGDRRRRADQRRHRLCPGRQGGAGAGRHPQHAVAARQWFCAAAIRLPSRRRIWCPATGCCWPRATRCQRTCGWSASRACAYRRRR
ncbi:cation-transporting P-type ATPase [Azospirillum baldaniorum]